MKVVARRPVSTIIRVMVRNLLPLLILAGFPGLLACGDDTAAPGADVVQLPPQPLGRSCLSDAECLSGVCMRSQYGTPFCTRACDTPWEGCPSGDDLPAGESALCVDMETRPNPDTPAFEGGLTRFCAPRCFENRECRALDAAWERCDVPSWLGDPLAPSIGNQRVCQSPSFHGKTPVDPSSCDWERTVEARFTNEATLCRAYCEYMWNCKELESDAGRTCCEWGCYNRMVAEGEVDDAWKDDTRCYVDNHAAWPDTGPRNSCTEPKAACGGTPVDPTPAAARPRSAEE
jgi:hypothetical protein